ncbi:PREDICTED: uncharacterized protein LOC107332023 [Acropora digitifera]|uniref:uncharacterized protein LOC107332023 n=1 Tax=Acropora digitifera TaxID=70779 RepID=UPI00077A2ACB|nr:PREDICTED: uncharacterized protein LOC107332023 [Acropora digitifera]
MADDSDLFLFGDNFDAILEIMETEDNIDVHFEDAVAEVQKDNIECQHCRKRCKSKSGLKRHINAKHKTFGETNDATREGKHQCQFTSEVLARMINEAKQRLTDNKVFPKNVREELRAYNFTGISEETEEFLNLQTIFKCLVKKTDAEKFYSMFYSTVPIKSTSYFAGLSRNAATLLSTKLADHICPTVRNKSVPTLQHLVPS